MGEPRLELARGEPHRWSPAARGTRWTGAGYDGEKGYRLEAGQTAS